MLSQLRVPDIFLGDERFEDLLVDLVAGPYLVVGGALIVLERAVNRAVAERSG